MAEADVKHGGNALPTAAPKVSVVIPTYGRKAFLAEAIASVLAQTFRDFELLVVDDASPEPVYLEGFDDPRIRRLQHDVNKGVAAARNTGAAAARGAWLAFLDDDDLWAPERLEAAFARVKATSVEICIVGSRTLGEDEQYPFRGRRFEGNCHASIIAATAPHLGATMVRRDTFIPFDETYVACEDLEWWIRISDRAVFTTVPETLLFWRRHDGPRVGYGLSRRIEYSRKLLGDHANYFQKHPGASAFRSFRLGYMLQCIAAYGASCAAYGRVVVHPGASARLRVSAARRLAGLLLPALRNAKT